MLKGREALEALLLQSRGRRHKYQVSAPEERTVGAILFASKAEAARWRELESLKASGLVRFALRQVPFHLPGRTRYVLDFLVVWTDGHLSFEEVKGHRTETYKLKRRQVEELYPVRIEELRPRRRR